MRPSGRATDAMREIGIEVGVNRHAEGSCLIRMGDTHVLCTASVDERVPPFLKNSGLGWVTKLDKGDFIGRDAVVEQSGKAADWEFIGLDITDPGPEPLPSDPILKDGALVGYLTSVSMGYRTGKLLALGYVKTGTLSMGDTCAVQAFGTHRRAIRHAHHVFDPDNARLRS